MRLLGERVLWNSQVEDIANKLHMKSAEDVYSILDGYDVITLKTVYVETTLSNRVSYLLLFIPLILLASIKWILTGNFYLDSWAKRSKSLSWLTSLAGRLL